MECRNCFILQRKGNGKLWTETILSQKQTNGVGRKVYVTRTEYELEYYDSVNYEILTAEEYIKACEENWFSAPLPFPASVLRSRLQSMFLIQKHSQQYIFNNGMQKSNRLRAAFCDMLLLRRGLIVIPGWAYCIKNVWLWLSYPVLEWTVSQRISELCALCA